jgi:hypothetical protein
MAKFVYIASEERSIISLRAESGEEIPTDMVAAWAAILQARALEEIARNVIGLDNALTHGFESLGDRLG